MKKILFDTDIGIDDAMALLYLHYSPQVELCAVTTGFGNASIDDTTRNALYVADRFRIDVPVFRGAAAPLGKRLGDGYPDFVHGSNGLGDIPIESGSTGAGDMDAAAAIVEFARRYPGELFVVAVGRLTNLALALERCPELPALLAGVCVMGGAFGYNGHRGNVSPVAEANIAGDPVAADRVFGSGLATTIVGLDVTQETIADEAFFAALRDEAGDAGTFIHDISRCYLDFHERLTGRRECPVHDSSAVAALLHPEFYEKKTVAVRVATGGVAIGQTIAGDPAAGYESPAWRNRPTVDICTGVQPGPVLDDYLGTLRLA